MKLWIVVIGFFLLVLGFAPGCGGGGTSTSSTGTTTTSTTSTSSTGGTIVRYAVEATKNGVLIDPNNIVQGETVQFDVAGYTDTNQRVVQSSSNWQVDATGQSEGNMSGSGQYTSTASGGPFAVSATAAGQPQAGTAQVRPPGQALVTGRLTDGQGKFVFGAMVDFYDGSNVKLDSATAQGDGTFRASVPASAVTFEVNKGSIPGGYYKEYFYIALKPATTTVTSGASSTTQTVGSTSNMNSGDTLKFMGTGSTRNVVNVLNPTQVVVDTTVSTSTGEVVKVFSSKWYLPKGLCRAPLPPLTNGQTSPLNSDVVIPSSINNPPPPPPSPCN